MFTSVGMRKPKRNVFDLSHEHKMSMQMGKLYPCLLQEIVPGDGFKVNSEVMMRLAPMLSPVMHRVNVYVHYFFVPNRIIWNEWEDFITGGEDGNANPPYPQVQVTDDTVDYFKVGTLADYLGLPDFGEGRTNPVNLSQLPFRAYQTIYNEYYRDQNVTPKINVPLDGVLIDDDQFNTLATIRSRAWEKDYFTSALPWAQRGAEANIPLGSIDPVYKSSSEAYKTVDDQLVNAQNISSDAQGKLTQATPARS